MLLVHIFYDYYPFAEFSSIDHRKSSFSFKSREMEMLNTVFFFPTVRIRS